MRFCPSGLPSFFRIVQELPNLLIDEKLFIHKCAYLIASMCINRMETYILKFNLPPPLDTKRTH